MDNDAFTGFAERLALQFRGEAPSALNHTNFSNPAASTSSLGQIGSVRNWSSGLRPGGCVQVRRASSPLFLHSTCAVPVAGSLDSANWRAAQQALDAADNFDPILLKVYLAWGILTLCDSLPVPTPGFGA
jgi:hypothetical protein